MPFQNRASCREPAKIEGKGANTKRDLKRWAHMCALTLKAVNSKQQLIYISKIIWLMVKAGDVCLFLRDTIPQHDLEQSAS